MPIVPVVPHFNENNPILPKGPDVSATPLPQKVVPPYPLRTKPKYTFDDVEVVLQKTKNLDPLLEAI